MTSRSLLVLMIDGWRARSIGAYGNTWYSTPALDRFASQSLVFDRYLADSTELARDYDALWTARHAVLPPPEESKPKLIERLRSSGYECQLVTDSESLLSHPLVELFDEATHVDTATTTFAESPVDTGFGKVLGTAAELIGEWSNKQPRCLWVHLRGFLAPWDAPPELAESLVDEDDPELTPSFEVPNASFESVEEVEDEIFLASCRYAGQVTALDECFGAFEAVLSELWPGEPPVLVLGGTQGFALGEHGAIGESDLPYGEQFHVPLLIRSPDTSLALQRERSLVQPADVAALIEQLAVGEDFAPPAAAFACGLTATGSLFLQNDEWHFVHAAAIEESEANCELYVKPDDLWEANDVASRCPDVVSELAEIAGRLQRRT